MIAAKPIHDLTRGLGRNAFDLPVAGLAALAVAFVAFAIPADLLGQLVSATGLPHLLAAAEPPLGFKARGAIGIAGAIAAFALVYMTMRALDRSGSKTPRREPEARRDQEESPRLRRRDLHPDAPVCRPISAIRDFGEPAPPPLAAADTPYRDEDALPHWLAEAAPEAEESQPTPAPEPEPEPEAEPEAVAPAIEKRHEPAATSVKPASEATIPELMRRLEQGLARRRTRQIFAPVQQQQQAPAQAPSPQVFPEANDDRLQSAIDSLQRFAARGE
jgi:hypothetical protein